MQLYLVRRASEYRRPFDFSNTNDIFSKREDAERRLRTVQEDSQAYLIETYDCPAVYSDDLELHPQCILETKNKFCYWHDVTDYLHKAFHRLYLNKYDQGSDPLKQSEKERLRKYAEEHISRLDSIFRNGPIAVRVPNYIAETYFLLTVLEEFKKLES
jgi:hypothetical protein